MEKYQFDSKEKWEKAKETMKIQRKAKIPYFVFWGIHEEDLKEPISFPCVMVIGYAGEGWHENDFVYPEDFNAGG